MSSVIQEPAASRKPAAGDAIVFTNTTKTFRVGKNTVTAVDDVSLSIRKGEIFGVIGYSGAGKSTLVRLINGLEPATSGSVLVNGQEIVGRREGQLSKARSDIGMIFQQFNLLTSRNVARNVEFPLELAGWPKAKRKARVNELLEFVGLSSLARNYPEQLSGGQKQRVGIARALANEPSILLADESTSALDPETTAEVLRLLKRVNEQLGITIVVITHEMDVVRTIADRIAVMEKGKVIETGSAFEIFSSPKTQTAKRFVSTVQHTEPTPDELAHLRTRHPGRLVTVEIADGSNVGRILSQGAARGVLFEVVHGGISTLQSKSFGSMTVELTGEDAAIDAVIAELSAETHVKELSA
ncbi:methionine ABC transporter ATP-binding protein [Arthrobacter sp. UM1]|uniref:methionine ABC transporter ATP-binding protein n=1 Tax=Arthrobacter sp. UM1 TaxID=2766776 RepID=UPI001CF6E1D5|nr:ATP-binding cassette domain-containing protein [Arthrobacter sp. UM1]MCB4208877.1 ATP-binding cassette domain-containing protein [Arthrobacter sp. UM1]